MHARLLHNLIQHLLVLLFWLSLIHASPTPKRSTSAVHFQYQPHLPRAPPPPPPPPPIPPSEAEYSYPPIVSSHYNLKFEDYPKWIKEHSEWLWKSREHHQAENEALHDYVSPYITHFEAKKDGWWAWFDLGRMWRQFLWEVIPGWFSGRSPPPKEDMFLLRAMERPLYMSVNELPEVFKSDVRVKGGESGPGGLDISTDL